MSIGGPRLGDGADSEIPPESTKPTGPEAGPDNIQKVMQALRLILNNTLGWSRLGAEPGKETQQGSPSKPTEPEAGYNINKILEGLRDALGLPTLAAKMQEVVKILRALGPQVLADDSVLIMEYIVSNLEKYVEKSGLELMNELSANGLLLYLTLLLREGFDWQKQFETAINTIRIVNEANPGLNLETNYTLPKLIEALANCNPDPTKLYEIIKSMPDPTLVFAPKGLALTHLTRPLIYNLKPSINDTFQPGVPRGEAAVYLIDAGDTYEMETQPPAVRERADGDNNRMTNQELRNLMINLGMGLDEHGWGMLAASLRSQDPPVTLDGSTYAIFTRDFDENPNRVGFGFFRFSMYYFDFVHSRPPNYARVRPAVMAKVEI